MILLFLFTICSIAGCASVNTQEKAEEQVTTSEESPIGEIQTNDVDSPQALEDNSKLNDSQPKNSKKEMTIKELLKQADDWLNIAEEYDYVLLPVVGSDHEETINLHKVDEWVSSYQEGKNAEIKILEYGNGAIVVYTLKCDGKEEYTIEYMTNAMDEPNIYLGEGVYARYSDYIFSDGLSEPLHLPLHVPRKELTGYEFDSDIEPDPAFLSMEEAYHIASAAIDGFYYERDFYHIYFDIEERDQLGIPDNHLNFRNTIMLSGNPCYVFEYQKDIDSETLVLAINMNGGTLLYLENEAYGGWIPIYDKNEEFIRPNV